MSQDFRTGVVSFTIAISQSVSTVVTAIGGRKIGLFLPTLNGVTSLGFLVGGDVKEVNSGDLVTLRNSSGIVALPANATGDFGIDITDQISGFSSFQVVLPAAQTAARNLKLLVRL